MDVFTFASKRTEFPWVITSLLVSTRYANENLRVVEVSWSLWVKALWKEIQEYAPFNFGKSMLELSSVVLDLPGYQNCAWSRRISNFQQDSGQ